MQKVEKKAPVLQHTVPTGGVEGKSSHDIWRMQLLGSGAKGQPFCADAAAGSKIANRPMARTETILLFMVDRYLSFAEKKQVTRARFLIAGIRREARQRPFAGQVGLAVPKSELPIQREVIAQEEAALHTQQLYRNIR